MKWIKNFILWLWQFPQNYLAFLVYGCLGYLCYYGGKCEGKNIIYSTYIPSSFSLGEFLTLQKRVLSMNLVTVISHNY